MKKVRNLAISGVDTIEKANKVYEIVGIEPNGYNIEDKEEFFYDDGSDMCFMYWWSPDEKNFKNCTQMTYEELLEKYDILEIDNHKFEKPDVSLSDWRYLDKFYISEWGNSAFIVGSIINHHQGVVPMMWELDGSVFDSGRLQLAYAEDKYSLTPLKKPWYEDKNNFPTLITTDTGNMVLVHHYEHGKVFDYIGTPYDVMGDGSNWRLATKAEIDGIYHA